jgi:hypothetical protein
MERAPTGADIASSFRLPERNAARRCQWRSASFIRNRMSYSDFKGNMRPQNKRSRRGGGGGGGMNPQHGGGGNPNRPRGPHRQQTFDSSGPGVKIRGNAYQVFERYIALAREAQSSGDRITAENLYQHAEHYFRVMNANGEQYGQHRSTMTPADNEQMQGDGDGNAQQGGEAQVEVRQPPQPQPEPPEAGSDGQNDQA